MKNEFTHSSKNTACVNYKLAKATTHTNLNSKHLTCLTQLDIEVLY